MPAGPRAGRRSGGMVEAGEAEWSGGDMIVPADLPKNTGRMLSDIVLEDRGPYSDEPGADEQ